jgi:hypothetical protein
MEAEEIQCQCENPFDRGSAIINQIFFSLPTAIGLCAIARYKPRKLPPALAGNLAIYTVMRRFVCARCQYYGQPCSTMLGVMTSKMMPRDETKKLDRNTMLIDFALIFGVGFYAVPQVINNRKLAIVYFASVMAAMGAIVFGCCEKCGNEFCPMKDVRKAITRQS